MKRTMLLLALGCTAFTSSSQQYTPLVTTGAKWNQEKYIYPQTPFGQIDEYLGQEYTIGGDTVINSELYQKVLYIRTYDQTFIDGNPGSVFCCPMDTVPYLIGAMREDSGQVFYRHLSSIPPVICGGYEPPLDIDILLYDFNLQENDVVMLGIQNHAVTAIDSVQLLNGDWRTRWTVYGLNDDIYWIEGIGSVGGLFEPFAQAFECYASLTCYHFNQDKLYEGPHFSPDYLDCGLLSVGINDPISSQDILELYPNPTTDVVTLHFASPSAGNYEVIFTDVLGRNLYYDILISGHQSEISLKNFTEGGLLFCHVLKDEKLVAVKKVVIIGK